MATQHLIDEIDSLRAVLVAYEEWEADLIMENKAWTGSNVQLTDELYERMIQIQGMRNKALFRT
jgi:hypothetical protein